MRVLIATGTSGGHIFPAKALRDALNCPDNSLLLVLPRTNKDNNFSIERGQIEYIHTAKLGFNLGVKNIYGVYSFLLGAWESLRLIIKFKPDVVVGFGSLNTIALVFWAWLFRKKTLIHEQNVIPGQANRLLAKLVDRVAVSFDQTSRYLNICGEKVVFTGNPVRKGLIRLEKKEALDFFKLKDGKFNILITGGSQGSHKLNTVCFEALVDFNAKDDLQVIHLCGSKDFSALKEAYASSNLTYKLFDFMPDMQYAYSIADLVICRAGATTIAELRLFGVPAILIPYPFAYAHQLANANVLKEQEAALVISDAEFTRKNLRDKLQELLGDNEKLKNMRQAYAKDQVLDSAAILAQEVLNLR